MEKKPFLTLQQVQEITKTYPTPFHIYDEKAIRENARKVKKAFAWNPGYKEYFAVKATPNPRLIQILHEEGFGCDCSSLPELQLSDVCGVKEHDIMFSSNVTPAEDYKLASDLNASTSCSRVMPYLASCGVSMMELFSTKSPPGLKRQDMVSFQSPTTLS